MGKPPVQSSLFPGRFPVDDVIDQVVAGLPVLPSVIRYYDDFDDVQHSIRDPADRAVFELAINGRTIRVDFTRFADTHAVLLKHVFLFLLGEDLSVSTAANYVIAASHLAFDDVTDIVRAGPIGITAVWTRLRVREMPLLAYILAKALLRLLCRHRLQGWSDTYDIYITTALPLPARDAYAGVRSGDVFLSADEEAAIVRHLDEMAEALTSSVETVHENVCDAGMLLWRAIESLGSGTLLQG
jgi:hypothetical protein